jgi:hypothetical protein
MKIGILSMQDVNNFGSVLQAYSLKKLIRSLGHDVGFFHINPNPDDDRLISKRDEFTVENEYNGFFSKFRKIDKYIINRLNQKLKNKKQFKIFDEFRNNYLNNYHFNEDVDYCVIGSDEVFNCMLNTRWGFTSQLFGNIPNASHIITYAASCGSSTIEQLPNGVKEKIRESFCNIESFSVRDNNTRVFVHSLSDKQITNNYDPVLIADFNYELSKVTLPRDFPKNKYCIIYSYPNRFHEKEDIEQIKAFCSRKQLEIISLGGYQMWVNRTFALTPFELLKAFQNAEFVITDTFHGTIFAEKYARRYAVLVRESNKNKLLDLIDKLDTEDHLIDSVFQLDNAFNIENDFNRIRKLEITERNKALSYLRKAMHEL